MENRKPFSTFAHYKIGKGLVTLAVSVDEGDARVGVSYCHPRDVMDKSFGRSVAVKRRDSKSTFSFAFKRTPGVKLVEQLRMEFEKFVQKASVSKVEIEKLLASGSLTNERDVRLGAPPWAIHSLNRELRRRAQFEKLLNQDLAPAKTAAPVAHSCCC